MTKNPSFVIEGLAGARTLKGTIHINGAKNAALKAMAAAILFDGPVTLENMPDTADIQTLTEILEKLGAKVTVKSVVIPAHVTSSKVTGIQGHTTHVNKTCGQILMIDPTNITSTDIDQTLAGGMRASVVLTGPLLTRYGKVSFPAPGGCVIGARPIDLFLSAYETLGATVTEDECLYHISSPQGGLKATTIEFKKISVGATETLMMAAILADGKTILTNCAREPEIVNVAEWLNECGANIVGAGTSTIEISGTKGKLLTPKKSFITIPDRIEAGSFLILASLCGEDITIENCRPDHMSVVIDLLKKSGVNISVESPFVKGGAPEGWGISTSIRVTNDSSTPRTFTSFDITTKEYPGFATDVQAPAVVFLTQAEGTSKVTETIFEGRFKYIEDLIVLGADITSVSPHEISITGPKSLSQQSPERDLTAHDIRAGFAVVLAALIAQGKSVVNNVQLIDRGYEKLEERLSALGAKVVRVTK